MPRSPSIAVVIPMYNAERTIATALTSVLEQTRPPEEIIVVDNGSTDRSLQIVAAYGSRLRLFTEATRGPGAARNHGVRQTRSECIAFLDADDCMPPDRLALQQAALMASAGAEMVLGLQCLFADGAMPGVQTPGSDCVFQGQIPSAAFCRRTLFDRVGLFEESLSAGEFIEWCARVRDAGIPVVMLPRVVVQRRVHADNLTRDSAAAGRAYVQALRHILQRRRAG